MLQKILKIFSQKGQGIVEYVLLISFVAVITFGLFNGEDGGLAGVFKDTLHSIMEHFTKFND